MFTEKTETSNFADDSTLYGCGKEYHFIMNNLKYHMSITFKWFKVSSLKASPGKFQFIILGNHQQNSVTVKVYKNR